MLLYAATKNQGKLREFLNAASDSRLTDLRIEPLPGLEMIEAPEEAGSSFEENAAIKARYYSDLTDGFVFADDSGLEVNALGGEPGVYSARYAGAAATDAANNSRLLDNLQGRQQRSGRFVCVIALARRGQILLVGRGSVEGEILTAPRGGEGFGYDPLFFCQEIGRTLAEATLEQKFQISHRGRAFRDLLNQMAASGLATP
jgi:XTP/dITP diphosphohydrolase